MADISQVRLPNGSFYSFKDNVSRTNVPYFVVGTQTEATGSWTGTLTAVNELYDGLSVLYYLPYAGSGSASLTLTLAGGVTSSIPVYYTGTSRATTHYGAGSVILLTYYNNAWRRADYNSDGSVTQNAVNTNNIDYPIILGYDARTTKATGAVNKASTLTYNPSTKELSVDGTINGYTLAAAAAKDVVTSIDTTEKLPTSGAVKTYVDSSINGLDGSITGSASASKTITSFSQTNGKVTATFSNIAIASSQVSGLGAAAAKGVDTSVAANSSSTNVPTSKAVAALVSNATAGLTGAMHFKGTTTTNLTDGTTTGTVKINGDNYTPSAGDVVLYSNKEFVWTGSIWEILGDEGSYALKSNTANVVKTVTLSPNTLPSLTITSTKIPNVTGVGSLPSLTITEKTIPNVTAAGTLPKLTVTSTSIPNVTGVGTLPKLTVTSTSIPNVTNVGTLPSLTVTNTSIPNVTSVGSAASFSVSNGTLTISPGSAPQLGTAINVGSASGWSQGTLPTLGTAISVGSASGWSAGTLPTLGTAISVGSASGWSAGTLPTIGTAITVGSASAWKAGSLPTLGDDITVGSASGWSKGSQASISTTEETVVIP